MTQTATLPWEAKRTDETRQIEEVLRKAGFDQVEPLATIRRRSESE